MDNLRMTKERSIAFECAYIYDRIVGSEHELRSVAEAVQCFQSESGFPLERIQIALNHQAYMLDKIADELAKERNRIGQIVSSIKKFVEGEEIVEGKVDHPLSELLADRAEQTVSRSYRLPEDGLEG